MDNQYPKNYSSTNNDPGLTETVKVVFQNVISDKDMAKDFKNQTVKIKMNMDAVLHQSPFKSFKPGKIYRYIVHPNGGLEMLEVK